VLLSCIANTRVEKTALFIPDVVFRLRVVKANVMYDNRVVEHAYGVGGELAKLMGDAVKAGIREWKPELERNLLAKANAAIVKAGDTREIRLGLSGIVGGKEPVARPTAQPRPGPPRAKVSPPTRG